MDNNLAMEGLMEELNSGLLKDLVDFDLEVLESEYDYKILMGRRFFVLHTGIGPAVRYAYGNDIKERGEFVTNISIILKDLIGKKILIADDTLLHGRAIKRIVEDLVRCGCSRKNIAVKIYLRNVDAKIVDDELAGLIARKVLPDNAECLEAVSCKRLKNTNDWRYVSSKIVDAFIGMGWPYIYYLPYYEVALDTDTARKILRFVEEQKLSNNAIRAQEVRGVSSYVYCDNEPFSMCRKNLIRIYKYEKAGKIILIPYAYLKPLTYNQISEMLKIFLAKGMVTFKEGGEFLGSAKELEKNRIKAQYAYSLLTYLVSLILGIVFLQKEGIENWEWNKNIENLSLGCETHISKENAGQLLTELVKVQILKNMDYALEKNEDIHKIITWILEGKSKVEVDYFLSCYLKLSSKRDEELANEKKDRMRGIEIERIQKYALEETKIWKKIIEVIDAGQGTITPTVHHIDGLEYMDSLLYTGEQNHAGNEKQLACFIYPLLQYAIYCRDKKIQDNENDKAALIEEIKLKVGGSDSVIAGKEITYLRKVSLYNDYLEYYLHRYALYMDDENVREAMSIEKTYEKK